MARKVTFDIPEDEEKQQSSSISPTRTQSRAPALSGMARSLQDAAQSSIQEISTDLIDDSEFQDRLALDDEDDIRELAESIDKQGQLIPILLKSRRGPVQDHLWAQAISGPSTYWQARKGSHQRLG